MTRTLTKTALLSAVALSTGFAAQTASAALITEWNYNVNSTFSDSTSGPSDTGGNENSVLGSGTNDVLGGSTTLTWGDNKGTIDTSDDGLTSSVSITPNVDSPPNPVLVTNGPSQDGATFTHNNQAISTDYAILDTFEITTQLNLTASMPDTGDEQQLGPITFNSFFTETRNQETCVGGSESVCDDIFVLTETTAPGNPLSSMESFTIDGQSYTVTLNIGGVETLTEEQCGRAGAGEGCFGFLTQEGQENNFTSSFNIVADVPEPGTLAMLGLGFGLVGFGFFARRRNEAPMA